MARSVHRRAPVLSSTTSSRLDALEQQVAALARIEAKLDQLLAASPKSRQSSKQDGRLLQAVVGAIPDCVFSSNELLAHAAVHDALRDAFAAVGIRSARQLGKRLQKLQGQSIGGLLVNRHGSDASGAIWSISVDESDGATLSSQKRVPTGANILV